MPSAELQDLKSLGVIGPYLAQRFPPFPTPSWLVGNFSHEVLRETVHAIVLEDGTAHFSKSKLTFRFKNHLRLVIAPFFAYRHSEKIAKDTFEESVSTIANHCIEAAASVGILLDTGDGNWSLGPSAAARIDDVSVLILDPTPTELLSEQLGVELLPHGASRIASEIPASASSRFVAGIEEYPQWVGENPWALEKGQYTPAGSDMFQIPTSDVEVFHIVNSKGSWIRGDKIESIWQALWKDIVLVRTPYVAANQIPRQYYIATDLIQREYMHVRCINRDSAARCRFQISKLITGESGLRITRNSGALHVSVPIELPFPENFITSCGIAQHVFGGVKWPAYCFHERFTPILDCFA